MADSGEVKTITFRFSGWTGWDLFRFEGRAPFPFANLLWSFLWIFFWPTQGHQTKAVAKALLEGPYKGFDFKNHHLAIAMPWGGFEVKDAVTKNNKVCQIQLKSCRPDAAVGMMG